MTTGVSRFLTAAGREVHFMEWGANNKDVIIMWHGLARTGRDFDELAEEMSADYRVICPDTLGRGLTQWAVNPDIEYCFDFYHKIILDLLDQLGIDQCHWVGTSMGGLIGTSLAAGPMKGRIKTLLINDIGPEIPQDAVDRIAQYVGNPPEFDTILEMETYLQTAYAPFGDNTDAFWRRMAETSYRRADNKKITVHYDPQIVNQFTLHKSDLDLWDAYDNLNIPVLLLRGVTSDVLPAAVADDMAARNKNTQLEILEGFGHAPTLCSELEIKLVKELLARG